MEERLYSPEVSNIDVSKDEKQIYGRNVEIVSKSADCTVYKLSNESGEALLTSYEIFTGIKLIYNEVNMNFCTVDAVHSEHLIEINHCREGSIEYEVGNSFVHISNGDFSIHNKNNESCSCFFSINYYKGISVIIDLEKIHGCLPDILADVPIDIGEMAKKFFMQSKYTVIRGEECFDHIFTELYSVPEKIRKGYQRIKVLELLLFLSGMDIKKESLETHYYTKCQVNAVRDIEMYLTENIDRHVTIQELSDKFGISKTLMKSCFKSVYGDSIYTYSRRYKMHKATFLLSHTDKKVTEIAGMLGYDNGSKFASAFRDVIGVSPKNYRNFSG